MKNIFSIIVFLGLILYLIWIVTASCDDMIKVLRTGDVPARCIVR